MPDSLNAKKEGDLVRVIRMDQSTPQIEVDWKFIRLEPNSGDLVAEKDNKRIVVAHDTYNKLNFPNSDSVWEIINSDPHDADLEKAKIAWTKLDLCAMIRALISYARSLDPGLRGVQTFSDLEAKVKELNETCRSSMEILRIDVKRAEREYVHCSCGTGLENDLKDSLLEHWRSLQDRYATRKHQHENLIPEWCKLISAIESIDASLH